MKPGGACEQGGGPQKGQPLFCIRRNGAVFRVGRWTLSSSAGLRDGMPAAEEEKVDGDGEAGCVRRFFVPGGAERFSASAGVSARPFSMVRRRSPRWVGGSRVVRLVETAGQAVPVVFFMSGRWRPGTPCPAVAGRDRTGSICPPPSALRPRWSGSGAVSRGREPNNGSGITFYGRKSSDFSK